MRWTPWRQVALCLLTLLAIALLTALGQALLESVGAPGPQSPAAPARLECAAASRAPAGAEASTPPAAARRVTLTARGARELDPATWDLGRPVAVPEAALRAYLAGTPLEDLAPAFLEAQAEHGVDAIALTAVAVLESGWGRWPLGPGGNNVTGYGAADSDPVRLARGFDSREACIDTTAALLGGDYLAADGRWFTGVTVAAVGRHYATDPAWGSKVAAIMREILATWVELELQNDRGAAAA